MNNKNALYIGLVVLAVALAAFFALGGPKGKEPRGMSPERAKAQIARIEKGFNAIDTDKDGNITKKEYLANAEKKFANLDANGDGTFTKQERAESRKKWLERNKVKGKPKKPMQKPEGNAAPDAKPAAADAAPAAAEPVKPEAKQEKPQ